MIRAPRVVRRLPRRSSQVRRNHYAPDLTRNAHSSNTNFAVAVIGDPVSWKRAAWVNLRSRMARSYDSQRIEKASLGLAITAALDAQHKELIVFGREEVVVYLTFNFTGTRNRRDVDNLIKFILDALQLANIFLNDVQVMEVRGRKVFGAQHNSTEIYIERHDVIVIED